MTLRMLQGKMKMQIVMLLFLALSFNFKLMDGSALKGKTNEVVTAGMDDDLTCSTEPVYYPPGTHDNHVFKCYPDLQLTFYWHGYPAHDNQTLDAGLSFGECTVRCARQRDEQGDEWDGIGYFYDNKLCECYKNSHKRLLLAHMLHYRFVSKQ